MAWPYKNARLPSHDKQWKFIVFIVFLAALDALAKDDLKEFFFLINIQVPHVKLHAHVDLWNLNSNICYITASLEQVLKVIKSKQSPPGLSPPAWGAVLVQPSKTHCWSSSVWKNRAQCSSPVCSENITLFCLWRGTSTLMMNSAGLLNEAQHPFAAVEMCK